MVGGVAKGRGRMKWEGKFGLAMGLKQRYNLSKGSSTVTSAKKRESCSYYLTPPSRQGTVMFRVDTQGDHDAVVVRHVNWPGGERLSVRRDVCQEERRIKWRKDL